MKNVKFYPLGFWLGLVLAVTGFIVSAIVLAVFWLQKLQVYVPEPIVAGFKRVGLDHTDYDQFSNFEAWAFVSGFCLLVSLYVLGFFSQKK